VTELLARVAGSSVTANCPPTKEAAMSTWLWVLIIVVVLVLVFGVMRRRGR
jgi:FtsH-binding integral membrane protein